MGESSPAASAPRIPVAHLFACHAELVKVRIKLPPYQEINGTATDALWSCRPLDVEKSGITCQPSASGPLRSHQQECVHST